MAEPKDPPPPQPPPKPDAVREKRLAEALRANLRRRKGKDGEAS
ncbi:MAG TPA: hypothetical protein VL358_10790 [Caulobacteraceae bacterium]|jgi:hypothetical protein|nr:hypothetical protein [Caulobacteraceae bacterium]